MRNPISYVLKPVPQVPDREVGLYLKSRRKQVKLIFQSFMRRLKAAHTFRIKQINASVALSDNVKKYELSNWNQQFCEWEAGCNTLYNHLIDDFLTPTKQGWLSDYVRPVPLHQAANRYIAAAHKELMFAADELKAFEKRAFNATRNLSKEKDKFSERDHHVFQARVLHKNLVELMRALKANYPYIREKYRNRLAKLLFSTLKCNANKTTNGYPDPVNFDPANFCLRHMVKIGIPAADAVGPWWPRTDKIKSPMGFVDWIDQNYGCIKMEDGTKVTYYDHKSPTEETWLSSIGLDAGDRALRTAVLHYYNQHKAPPSAAWARRRSNEIDEERKQEDMKKQIGPVRDWLKVMKHAREITPDIRIDVPALKGKWRVVVPADAQELCERAQRDGLCVVDVISRLSLDSEDEDDCYRRSANEGVCTLLFSTDPKCRTIVGLDADGKCTSEHHCTGKNNEVDEEAWEYFKG
jgi:hypothetical protein